MISYGYKLINKQIEEGGSMAKETQKAKIARLENQNEELYKHIQKLIENGENSFLNSPTYNQMKREIEVLKAAAKVDELAIKNGRELRGRQAVIIEQLQNELKQAKEEIQALKEQQPIKVHNERGAGRKQKFNDVEIEEIKTMYANGKSMRAIAKEKKCSSALVCKLINEQN